MVTLQSSPLLPQKKPQKKRPQKKWLTALISLFCGAVSVLAFAPFGLWMLLPLTLAVFFVVLYHSNTRGSSFRSGYFFGVGLFGAGIYWIYFSLHLFGGAIAFVAGLGTFLFVLFLALYPALFAMLVHRFANGSRWFFLTAPAMWVLFEWLRSWFLTGFPWLNAGYSTLNSPLAGYAPVGGVFLSSLVLVLCSGLLAFCLCRRTVVSGIVALCSVGLLFAGGYALQQIQWTQPVQDRTVDVTMVQGNIAQELKFQPNLLEDSITLYSSLSNTGAELVIWPESAIPTVYSDLAQWEVDFAERMAQNGTAVISGGFTSNEDYSVFFNAIKVLNGRDDQVYVKRHLVPFGEYTPFRDVLTLLAEHITIPMSDLSPGSGPVAPITVNGVNYGMSICYEDAFGSEMRAQFPAANVLINVSNDAWFGDSTAPHQHQEIAAMRSLEFGRPMLRVTNTGITSLIDYRGHVVQRGPQFEAVAIDVEVTPRQGATPYVTLGDWLAVLLSVAMLLPAVFSSRMKTHRTPGADGGEDDTDS